jgi:hypothetical protein
MTALGLDLVLDVGTRSLWDPTGQTPDSAGFDAIQVTAHMRADASPEALRTLVAHAALCSPIADIIRPRAPGRVRAHGTEVPNG